MVPEPYQLSSDGGGHRHGVGCGGCGILITLLKRLSIRNTIQTNFVTGQYVFECRGHMEQFMKFHFPFHPHYRRSVLVHLMALLEHGMSGSSGNYLLVEAMLRYSFWTGEMVITWHVWRSPIWMMSHSREVSFEDARSLASTKWNLDDIDYFVDCHYFEIDHLRYGHGDMGEESSPATVLTRLLDVVVAIDRKIEADEIINLVEIRYANGIDACGIDFQLLSLEIKLYLDC
ncbi:hypothetical protein ZIOFF_036768 [Zingiber officinale]|uniref:Uncharacterized protein n=1 Tax=Zingiber officinale TaxID=94328 RepID=A0A8J5GAH9_ZINOF|nr:hypothetical protein ZIOFF_036768 [Zingiber officinale]